MVIINQACDVAFVGDLIKRGGHNPIEPALTGVEAIIVGPSVL